MYRAVSFSHPVPVPNGQKLDAGGPEVKRKLIKSLFMGVSILLSCKLITAVARSWDQDCQRVPNVSSHGNEFPECCDSALISRRLLWLRSCKALAIGVTAVCVSQLLPRQVLF